MVYILNGSSLRFNEKEDQWVIPEKDLEAVSASQTVLCWQI